VKIFVSVGNTQYNSLIKAIDELLSAKEFDITIQIANGSYIPINHKYFRLTDNISNYYQEADLVVAHAGAGTVFQLLEEERKAVVVPNLERVDDHQLDLAQYVEEHKFANVCYDINQIRESIITAINTHYEKYKVDPFSGYGFINTLFSQVNAEQKYSTEVGDLPLTIFVNMKEAVDHVIDDDGNVLSGSAIAINPEKVIRSLNDATVREAIMSATIRYADGIGVVKTLARKSRQKVSRIPGCEYWEAIMEKSGGFDIPVFLVGASQNVITNTVELLKKQYSVNVCGFQDGYFDPNKESDVIARIEKLQPKIVSVALGSPRQELFIQKCKVNCPNTFFMGVGGTYDVYTNNVTRAPLIYRKLNLEWFYRLMSQPKRLFRQTNLLKYLYLEITRRL